MSDVTPTAGGMPVPPAPGATPPGTPGPPPTPAAASRPEPAPGRTRLWPVLLAAVVALLIGVGIGYAASIPATNSVEDDKQALEDRNGELKKQVAQMQDDLELSTEGSEAKDICVQAATDAGDYITQDDNWHQDFTAYMASEVGSAAEAELETHMIDQEQKMQEQYETVQQELDNCSEALG